MTENVWRQVAECNSCKGTGLYAGFAERDGFAVVCHTCKGTGRREIEVRWHEFNGRKEREGVERVLAANPGIGVGVSAERGLTIESFGGVPYEEWLATGTFPHGSEMREFTCPAWWYQGVDYDRKPRWNECMLGAVFSECSHFPNKRACWERFDAEASDDIAPLREE